MKTRRISLSIAALTLLFSGAVLAENPPSPNVQQPGESNQMSPEEAGIQEAEMVSLGASPHVIPAASFSDDGFQPDDTFFFFATGQLRGTAGGFGCQKAPVYLPNGATVSSMFATINDTDAGDDVTVTLWKADSFSLATTVMASATTSGAPGLVSIFDGTIVDPTIVHPNDVLYVTTCLNTADTAILNARIYFSQ